MREKITDMLKKVRRIEIRTNRQVSDALAGAYHSVFKGRGMNFEESREYHAGDETRSIDWNVTARTGKAHVKQYKEERELTIMIVVDLSASGLFGSSQESKREKAAELASTLAFSATRNNDKVGLALFTDKVELLIPPRKGRQHILRLIREVLFFEPKSLRTNIAITLDEINRVLKRKAVVFLISDFLQGADGLLPTEESSDVLKALTLTNKRHDLICFNIIDSREKFLPEIGLLNLEDSETGECVVVDTTNGSVRNDYEKFNTQRLQDFKKALKKSDIDLLNIETDKAYINSLKSFFDSRRKRR